jgi:Fe-S cluster assembly protein SufD
MSDLPPTAYRDSMLAGLAGLRRAPDDWLNRLRGAALEAAHRLTLPGRADEDWRFTDLSALYRLAFSPVTRPGMPAPADLASFVIPEAAQRLVFVDGVHAPGLSQTRDGDAAATVGGVMAGDLRRALAFAGARVSDTLGTLCGVEQNAFAAINTAWLQDAAVIIADRAPAARHAPVHILFVSTQPEVAVHPRVLVLAGDSADVTFIEDHVSLHQGRYCANGVTEIAVGANARVRHVRLQRESESAYNIASCAVSVARDGVFQSHAVSSGAEISRYDLRVIQRAEGVHMSANGLALLDGRQVADTHSFFEHGAPRGTSRQKHKTILGGRSHAVFNGRILVSQGAQGTDSAQQSRNLLLSDRARVDTKPQLEIFADDVKCSHGATVGQLESEELFYLRTRGMTPRQARNLLTYAFAAEIIDGIPVPSIVRRLRDAVMARTGALESRTEQKESA